MKEQIEKGDIVECTGGYPHWKGMLFECTMIFNDNKIGILNGVKVCADCFKIVEKLKNKK